MAFSKDGNYLACSSSNETIHVFNCNGNSNNNNGNSKSPSNEQQSQQQQSESTNFSSASILEYVHGYERAFLLYKNAAGQGAQTVTFGKKNNQILIITKGGCFFRVEFDEKGKILKDEAIDFSKKFLPSFVSFLDENTKKLKNDKKK